MFFLLISAHFNKCLHSRKHTGGMRATKEMSERESESASLAPFIRLPNFRGSVPAAGFPMTSGSGHGYSPAGEKDHTHNHTDLTARNSNKNYWITNRNVIIIKLNSYHNFIFLSCLMKEIAFSAFATLSYLLLNNKA